MKISYPLKAYLIFNKDLSKVRPNTALNLYQENCRIYLDEYEVEEWDYIPLFDNTFIIDRFMRKQ